jgi:hypothetical protein
VVGRRGGNKLRDLLSPSGYVHAEAPAGRRQAQLQDPQPVQQPPPMQRFVCSCSRSLRLLSCLPWRGLIAGAFFRWGNYHMPQLLILQEFGDVLPSGKGDKMIVTCNY